MNRSVGVGSSKSGGMVLPGRVFDQGLRAARTWNVFALIAVALVLFAGPLQAGEQAGERGQGPLDLNRATAAQLEALPGIGEVKAAAILAVRDERGGFGSMDELETVRGIGPSLAAKLKPLLKLGSGSGSGAARKVSAKGRTTAK